MTKPLERKVASFIFIERFRLWTIQRRLSVEKILLQLQKSFELVLVDRIKMFVKTSLYGL